jgi:hypothetical protein
MIIWVGFNEAKADVKEVKNMIRYIIGAAIGAIIGGVIGYVGKCSGSG